MSAGKADKSVKSAPKPHNPQRGPGRPALVEDAEVVAALVAAYKRGLKPHAAARSVGLHPTTVEKWKHRAQTGEEPYATVVGRLERASAGLCGELVDILVETARGRLNPATGLRDPPSVATARWLLERRFGWGSTAPIPHAPETPPKEDEVVDEVEDLDTRAADLEARARRIRLIQEPTPADLAAPANGATSPGRKL